MASIAFIGTGVMGRSIAGHLQRGGHVLHVFNRTRAKADELVANGAHWHDCAGDAAAAAEYVFTMVGFPHDVEQSYFGPGGVLERAQRGAVLIDLTTSSPALARRIALDAAARGLAAIDAPVSGGDIGAREGRLVIMAGGDSDSFTRARPLLELFGKNIALLGAAGAGQYCKMANQIAVAIGMAAWVEGLAFARQAGLDPAAVHASIAGGAAGSWAMANLAPRALAGNYAPGFYVKHLLKDLRIASEAAGEMALPLPALERVHELYSRLAAAGHEDDGTQALYWLYTERRTAD